MQTLRIKLRSWLDHALNKFDEIYSGERPDFRWIQEIKE